MIFFLLVGFLFFLYSSNMAVKINATPRNPRAIPMLYSKKTHEKTEQNAL